MFFVPHFRNIHCVCFIIFFVLAHESAEKKMALIENSPATNWQRWKIMLARVISLNFWDKNVPIDNRQCRHNV